MPGAASGGLAWARSEGTGVPGSRGLRPQPKGIGRRQRAPGSARAPSPWQRRSRPPLYLRGGLLRIHSPAEDRVGNSLMASSGTRRPERTPRGKPGSSSRPGWTPLSRTVPSHAQFPLARADIHLVVGRVINLLLDMLSETGLARAPEGGRDESVSCQRPHEPDVADAVNIFLG